jgi:hypothetical protein
MTAKKQKLKSPTTLIETWAKQFTENAPIEEYSNADLYISGASAVLGRLRELVNEHALHEAKGSYDKGLHDGLLWAWESVAEMFLLDGDTLEQLGVK